MKYRMFLVVLMCCSMCSFANTIDVSAKVYAELPNISLLAISPNAKRMAYRVNKQGQDLIIAIDRESGKLIKGASLEGINPNNVYFLSDDTVILIATKNVRIGGYRGRYDASWAYAFNLENGKIHALLSQDYGIYKGQTQLGRILGISKDKEYAYMPAYENPGSFNLYKVNLKKRRLPRIYQRGTSDTNDFFVGDDGEVLARERFSNKKNLHRIEARHDDEWVEIYREETDVISKGFYGLTPDKKHLVFRSYNYDNGRRSYYKMALKDGAISEPLFSREDKDVSHLLTDVYRIVHGVSYTGFTPEYEFFDSKLNARMKGIAKVMPNHLFRIRDYTSDWSNIVFQMDGNDTSGDYILYSQGMLEMLAPIRPNIPPEAVNSVIEYNYEARDKLNIPTLLTVPKGKKMQNLPAIIMPHGGPASHDKKGFDYMAQYFASNGYLVVQPQFRGSTGFGLAFLQAGHGEWGRKMQDDLTDAVKALTRDGKIDPKRVCIVGSSYGGYAALAGAAFTPDVYQCAVAINGVSDINEMMASEKFDHGSDHWVLAYWEDIIANGEFNDEHLAAISPINFVKQITSPVLLIHGQYDEVVPVNQSREMAEALEDEDKNVTFVELEKGDHHLSKSENRMKAMLAIEEFIKKHI